MNICNFKLPDDYSSKKYTVSIDDRNNLKFNKLNWFRKVVRYFHTPKNEDIKVIWKKVKEEVNKAGDGELKNLDMRRLSVISSIARRADGTPHETDSQNILKRLEKIASNNYVDKVSKEEEV